MALPTRFFTGALFVCIVGGVAPAAAQDQAEPTPVMEYQQSVMSGIGAARGAIGAILDDEVPHRGHVLGHALALQQFATMASDIFPQGSAGEGSRARPEIWQDRAEFADALAAFQRAADGLVGAARSGSNATISEAFDTLAGTCGGCHRPFRARASG